jgi:hypothetical protein
VRWWLAGLIAFILLVGAPYVLGQWQMQKELDRETITQLWLVSDASRQQLKFTVGQDSGDTRLFEEGLVTISLKAYDTSNTRVSLLRCAEAMSCVSETVSFSEYLDVKTSLTMSQIL